MTFLVLLGGLIVTHFHTSDDIEVLVQLTDWYQKEKSQLDQYLFLSSADILKFICSFTLILRADSFLRAILQIAMRLAEKSDTQLDDIVVGSAMVIFKVKQTYPHGR